MLNRRNVASLVLSKMELQYTDFPVSKNRSCMTSAVVVR
jgi:hypothetical protein